MVAIAVALLLRKIIKTKGHKPIISTLHLVDDGVD